MDKGFMSYFLCCLLQIKLSHVGTNAITGIHPTSGKVLPSCKEQMSLYKLVPYGLLSTEIFWNYPYNINLLPAF